MEIQDAKTSFEGKKASNYLVVMSFGREEVVDYDQFKALMELIFKAQADWATINHIVIQIKDIRICEPTTKLTETQKKEKEKQALQAFA